MISPVFATFLTVNRVTVDAIDAHFLFVRCLSPTWTCHRWRERAVLIRMVCGYHAGFADYPYFSNM